MRPALTFRRTQAGAEVDLFLGDGRRLVPIEIKLGATASHHDIAGLRRCMSDLGLKRGWVVAKTMQRRKIGTSVEVVPGAEGGESFGIRIFSPRR